jgi:hypothetical protein
MPVQGQILDWSMMARSQGRIKTSKIHAFANSIGFSLSPVLMAHDLLAWVSVGSGFFDQTLLSHVRASSQIDRAQFVEGSRR